MQIEASCSEAMNLAYLASCVIRGTIPDAQRIAKMDLSTLYKTAERHMMTSITAVALESAGIKDHAFTQAKGKAIRKEAVFDIERAAVMSALEEAGIWHMPLKGAVLKGLYPKLGTRQMSDNDILFDQAATDQVDNIMKGLGYRLDHKSKVHISYFKEPVCNFEMHTTLFSPAGMDTLYSYYRDVKGRLIPDDNTQYRYHFSDEDFYVYMTAHSYKHFINGGTGLRSFMDIFVFFSKKKDTLQWQYIEAELAKLGIAEYEKMNRNLAIHLFSDEELTAQEHEMLEYALSSGAYGTSQHRIDYKLTQLGGGKKARIRYLFRRVFVPREFIIDVYPVFAKYPFLFFLHPFYRFYKGMSSNRKMLKREFSSFIRSKK